MKKDFIATIIVVVLAILLIVGMLLYYFLAVVQEKSPGSKTVTLEILYADNQYRYEDLETTATTVADLLAAYDQELELGVVCDSSIYGKFLTSLKDTPQNQAEGIYYTYEKNGDYALGIDVETITDGDVITFKYGITEYDASYNAVGFTFADGGNDSITSTPLNSITVGFVAFCVIGGVAILGGLAYVIYNANRKKN